MPFQPGGVRLGLKPVVSTSVFYLGVEMMCRALDIEGGGGERKLFQNSFSV